MQNAKQEAVDKRNDDRATIEGELDKGYPVPVNWIRMCNQCGKSFRMFVTTKREFEKYTFEWGDVLISRLIVPEKNVLCEDCKTGGRKKL